jgi:hypothetical protein
VAGRRRETGRRPARRGRFGDPPEDEKPRPVVRGLEHLDPARPWTLLAIPMITLLGLLTLREARRGRPSVILRRTRGWYGLRARAGAWMFGLCWPVFVLWALGVVRLGD